MEAALSPALELAWSEQGSSLVTPSRNVLLANCQQKPKESSFAKQASKKHKLSEYAQYPEPKKRKTLTSLKSSG